VVAVAGRVGQSPHTGERRQCQHPPGLVVAGAIPSRNCTRVSAA
jgi:hypothetical protein